MKKILFVILLSLFTAVSSFSTESVTDYELELKLTRQLISNTNFLQTLSEYTAKGYEVADIVYYFGSLDDGGYQVQIYLTKGKGYICLAGSMNSKRGEVSEFKEFKFKK